jgi:MFS transporter, AAHS family, 4-hydroxybenzoate transporter
LFSFFVGVLIVMVDGFDLQAIGFVAPEIAKSWSLTLADFGPVFSAGLAGSMLGALSAGPLARRLSLRAVLALALLVFGTATLCSTLVTTRAGLIGLRFIVGLGVGAAVPIVISLTAAASSPRFRSTLVVLTLCGQPIGAIVGGALCAHYLPIYGWHFAFYLGGLFPLILILGMLKPHEVSGQSIASVSSRTESRLRNLFNAQYLRKTLALWACSFLGIFFIYIVVNWLPGMVRSFGYTFQQSVLAISLFNFGGIAGALIVGALIDRFGPWVLVPSSFGVAALSLACLAIPEQSPAIFLSASFLSGMAGYGGVMSLASVTILIYPKDLHAAGVGWVLGIGRLGAAVGPIGAGFALGLGFRIGLLFVFAAAAAVLVVLSLLILARMVAKERPAHVVMGAVG